MEIPKWDFFDRIEKLEKIGPKLKKIEKIERRLDRVEKMCVINFELVFICLIGVAVGPGTSVRKVKDLVAGLLKKRGLSKDVIDTMNEYMLEVCNEWEKRRGIKSNK